MKSFAWMLALVFLFVLMPLTFMGVAFAEETVAEPNGFMVFFDNVAFPVIEAVVLVLLGIFVRWAAKKFKTDFLLQNQSLLERLALQGVGYVEELAAKRVKEGVELTSNQKLNGAVDFILKRSPAISRDDAEKAIESALAFVKGAGATGEKAL